MTPSTRLTIRVLGNARLGVDGGLDVAVDGERRVGDLDDEARARGVLVGVAARCHEREIGLRLRAVRRGEGGLHANVSARVERPDEQPGRLLDGVLVRRPLGAHAHDPAAQELDPLVVERAEGDELVVLGALERSDEGGVG